MEPVFPSDLPASVRGAVANVHERIVAAVQRVGQKETAATEMADCTAVPA
jgi:hypothetical protein